MATFSDLFARLDPDPRVRGKQFEHVCKWFLTNDPLYKARLHRVWLWKEWPNRWSDAEAGIDLVAEDTSGHLWAVQAKAYAVGKPIPKRELNKFLAESNIDRFHQRLLIATTDELHHIAQRTVDAQRKDVTFVGLSDLRAADEYLEWPDSPDHLRPSPPPKPSKPHDHQCEAINDVVKGFRSADRGQLIMACGTGKTLTSLFIKEKLAANRTLVLVPSLSLLKQTMRVWYANRRDEFAALPVCSDATVTRADDAIVERTSELGVPVTTDATEIAAFLRQRGPRVVFATYQSSPQIEAAYALGRVPRFDLVIADEAHRCAGPVSSDFATILDPTAIRAERRLFMTATPRYFTGRVIRTAKEADFEYASMDDQTKFGIAFHRLGFSDAIKRGLLTDYQVAIIGVDDATYKDWAEKGTLVTLDGKTPVNARTLAGQIGLAKAMRKYNLRRTISFHSRVSTARQFAASMHDVLAWMPPRRRPAGRLWAEHASGEMSAGDRYRLLQKLSDLDDDEHGLLANARCLAEGVDVPALDGVAFIDPRRSEVDIVQAVGRAIRKSDNKIIGTIVIPVFIDSDADPEVALGSSVFKPVWDVIRALRAHDAELGAQLDELRREMGKLSGVPRLPDKIHSDIPATVGAAFARAFEVRLVEQTTTSWELYFGMLERYVDQHGDARVLQTYMVDGFRLGTWVQTQRSKYSEGTLDSDRQRRLEGLRGWTWDPYSDDWERGFRLLRDYVEQNGHARVLRSYEVDGFRLGEWVKMQRDKNAKGILDPSREHRLKELQGWTWDPYADRWEDGFRHLLDYVERSGHARVLRNDVIDGCPIGRWVSKQRARRAKGVLELDRQQRLQALPGWSWDALLDRWEEVYGYLLVYVERHGHARVKQSDTINGYPIGNWVITQRSFYSKGILGAGRQQRLEELAGWSWDPYADRWEEGFSRLLEYLEDNGHARPRRSDRINGYPIGKWVNKQRIRYANGTLEPERQQRLKELAEWTWDASADRGRGRSLR